MSTTLAQILRRHWPAYVAKHGAASILPSHHAAVGAILSCHTPQRGGSVYRCQCGQTHFAFHGCGHRACPQCGQREAAAWIARQTARLLPVPYHLLTFTVPEELRAVIRSNQRVMLDLLFKESAATLQDVARTKLRAELGFLGALHTWSRQLIYHPHVHYIVPALGLSHDGSPVTPRDPQFLLRVEVLSERFRSRFRNALQNHPALFAQIAPSVWRKDWVVHSKPVGSGKQALAYLSRYIYRTAICSERQLQEKEGFVSFSYRDSNTRELRIARLPPSRSLPGSSSTSSQSACAASAPSAASVPLPKPNITACARCSTPCRLSSRPLRPASRPSFAARAAKSPCVLLAPSNAPRRHAKCRSQTRHARALAQNPAPVVPGLLCRNSPNLQKKSPNRPETTDRNAFKAPKSSKNPPSSLADAQKHPSALLPHPSRGKS